MARTDLTHTHHRHATGEVHQRLRRFRALGLVARWNHDPDTDEWLITLTTPERHLLTAEQVWAFLSGLASGKYAAIAQPNTTKAVDL